MTVSEIRGVVHNWMAGRLSRKEIGLGLPEYDDRLSVWRVALVPQHNSREPVGEVRVAAGEVVFNTDLSLAKRRCKDVQPAQPSTRKKTITFCPIPSQMILGDAADVLADFPAGSAQLVFTSPPYYNAKPEAHESYAYEDYLEMLRDIFSKCHDVLSEGRFLVVNTSPVLIRRTSRSVSSRRVPIPFDLHRILDGIGFDFIDDIIWEKPEGAGWHLGRGRRFAADRQPLQYKAVTVTENIVVYRKRTDRLIDWNLRYHPNPDALKASLIGDDYEKTNIWRIHPAHHKEHPAVFPEAMADRVIRYYSFAGDMVLDPFAGTGTTGRVAGRLERRFMLVENSIAYFNTQLSDSELRLYEPKIRDFEFFASAV